MARYYRLLAWAYALAVLFWVFLWIPFGIGYYGLPWRSFGFRCLIQLWAWALVAAGIFLVVHGARHRRRWWPSAAALALSLLALVVMYDWMARYVPQL